MTENESSVPQGLARTKGAKERVLESLRELPIVTAAIKRAGISRATYYRWQKEDSTFLADSYEAIRSGLELINDMDETQLIALGKERKMPAIVFWLKHNHPHYGGTLDPMRRGKNGGRRIVDIVGLVTKLEAENNAQKDPPEAVGLPQWLQQD